VVAREDKRNHPNTSDKVLIPDFETFERYKYTAFAPNLEFSTAMVWQFYNQCADCENHNRELKYDYILKDSVCMTFTRMKQLLDGRLQHIT